MNAPDPPDIRLGTLSLNLWFIGQFLSILIPAEQSAGPGQWIAAVSGLMMVGAGLMRTANQWHRLPRSLQTFVTLGTLLLVPMMLQGLFQGMDDPLYTALQAVPWLAAIYMPALGWPRIPDSLSACFRWHAFIGVAITAVYISLNWGILSSDVINREETLGIKVVQFLLYSLFFQLFRIGSESRLHQLVALAGVAEMLIIAFGSGSRQPLFILTGVILVAVWTTMRSVHGIAARAGRKFAVLLGIGVFIVATVYYILSNLHGAVDLLTQRLTTDRQGSSLADNSRLEELRQLHDQFGPVDYVFGRGIRGEFVNTAAPKQDNVHIGWFRTMLKGGVPMMLLLLVGYVLYAARAMVSQRDPVVLAAAGIVLYFSFKNSTGNIILPNGHFYITTICVGAIHAVAFRGPPRPPSRP